MVDLQAFAELIERCEAFAHKSPRMYRLSVGSLALFGISVVVLALLGAVLLVVGIVAVALYSRHGIVIKLAILPAAFAYMIAKALWMRIPEPDGVIVNAKSAPKLMEEIRAIRAKLGSLKVHRTLIAPEQFNACVVQIPRLGPLGWPRNYLVIGLPLIEAITLEEFRAVIAHELGHLSRRQARFRNWVYRTRQMWSHLSEQAGTGLLRPFLRWFGPYFNAYTFVLARANEYDADRAAASIAGPEVAARALTATSIKGNYLGERFWADLSKRARSEPNPPAQPFVDYLRQARALPPEELEAGLRQALAVKTSLHDTHPCLKDRLQPLGGEPILPEPVRVSAAEVLLGDLRNALIAQTDGKWAKSLGERWQGANQLGVEERARIEDLRSRAGSLEAAELVEFASLIEKHDNAAQARPWLDTAIARQPDYAPALFMRGRLRLAAGDDGGADEIDEAMRLDAGAVEAGSQLLYDHFSSRREVQRSQKYLHNLNSIHEKRQAAIAERTTINPTDKFVGHGLPEEVLEPIAATCAASPRLRRAWLAQKVVRHFPEQPLYLLVVDRGLLRKFKAAELTAISQALQASATLVVDRRQHAALARRIIRAAARPVFIRR